MPTPDVRRQCVDRAAFDSYDVGRHAFPAPCSSSEDLMDADRSGDLTYEERVPQKPNAEIAEPSSNVCGFDADKTAARLQAVRQGKSFFRNAEDNSALNRLRLVGKAAQFAAFPPAPKPCVYFIRLSAAPRLSMQQTSHR